VFLMTWMHLGEIDHLLHELSLIETLVHEQVVFLMHSSMASLASSLENFESSSESGRVVGVPALLRRPMQMTMMQTN
jgi:hypothetical protein